MFLYIYTHMIYLDHVLLIFNLFCLIVLFFLHEIVSPAPQLALNSL